MLHEEKRKEFLKRLQTWPLYCLLEKYFNNTGPGVIKKIKRFFLSPSVYLPYSLWRLGLYKKGKEVETKLFFGRSIKIPLVDCDAFYLYFFGLLGDPIEVKLTKFFIKNFKKNDIFYDVGASWGFYTYLALEFCKEVHCFEPLPHVFGTLSKNLLNEPKCFLNNLALSNFNGVSKMYVSPYSGRSTIEREIFQKDEKSFNKEILVKTTTLDEYLKTHNPPTIIKLDVEGAEKLVIEGGKIFLKNYSPLIAMEVWVRGGNLESFHEKAVQLLKELGYKSFFLTQEGDLKRVVGNLHEEVEKKDFSRDNFIFLKENI